MSEISELSDDIYLIIHSKITEICFDADRIDNDLGAYEKSFLKKNLIRSIGDLKRLQAENRSAFDLSFAKAVRMFLDSAKINLTTPLNDGNKLTLYNAIISLKLFQSIEIFEGRYLRKIKKLN